MKTRWWILLLGILFALFGLLTLFFFMPQSQAHSAEIWSEGKLLQTVSLHQEQSFVVEGSRGSNTVTVKDGKISVTGASCPDHYCMQRGECDSGPDIICLPNQLIIKFTNQNELDATAG